LAPSVRTSTTGSAYSNDASPPFEHAGLTMEAPRTGTIGASVLGKIWLFVVSALAPRRER